MLGKDGDVKQPDLVHRASDPDPPDRLAVAQNDPVLRIGEVGSIVGSLRFVRASGSSLAIRHMKLLDSNSMTIR